MYINLHTHRPVLSPDTFEIESVYFGQHRVPSAQPHSIGLHPWHLDGLVWDTAALWLETQAALSSTLAIGEAGLDKICQSPWGLQIQAFQQCAAMAEKMGKPLIIHCVRAHSEILALKKAWKPKQPWVFHGFDKKQAIADRLLQAGCYLSFGAALFRENSAASECLRKVPGNRFFLETDDAAISIEAVYERAAWLRGMEMGTLRQVLMDNFYAITGVKMS